MTTRYTLGASERLKREAHIEALFQYGKALSFSPLRIIWRLAPLAAGEFFSIRAGFSAPKKKFRRATDRARIKRLLREAWRLQRYALEASIPEGQQLQVFLLFNGTELPDYETVSDLVGKAIPALQKAIMPPSHG